MKKLITLLLLFTMSVTLCACGTSEKAGSFDRAVIDFGKSELYSENDLENALDVVKAKFKAWHGFEMHSVTYKGDDFSADNIDYCNSLKENAGFTECIVFESDFTTGNEYWSGFTANQEYKGWQWYLAREKDGKWQLVTYGVC